MAGWVERRCCCSERYVERSMRLSGMMCRSCDCGGAVRDSQSLALRGHYHLHHDRAHLVDLAHDLGALAEVADRVGNVGRLVHVKAVVDLQLRLGRPDLLPEPLVCELKGNGLGIKRSSRGLDFEQATGRTDIASRHRTSQ